jgi:hypothetical protein
MRSISLAVFAMALGALMFVGGRDPNLPQRSASLSRAPIDGPGVYHFKARHVYKTPQGEQTEVREVEFWLDPVTQDAQLSERSLTGGYQGIERRDGLTYSMEFPAESAIGTITKLDANAPFLQYLQERALYYKGALESGELRPLGEQVVNGHMATVVQRRVGLDGVDAQKAFVDKASGLPLKIISYRDVPLGGLEEVEEHLIDYQVIEWVQHDRLPGGLFAAPSAEKRSDQVDMTTETARRFGEFGIYWLGPSFGERPLANVYHTSSINLGGPGRRESAVNVIYAHLPSVDGKPQDGTDVHIYQKAASKTSASPSCGGELSGSEGETVTIGDRQALLCGVEGEALQLLLTIDGTDLTVHAKYRRDALGAAESLRRLN